MSTREICWWKVFCFALLLCAAATAARAQTFTTLLDFDGTNGANPGSMSLVQGRDGNLYGTTSGGGAYGAGTVFRITPQGNLTTLYSFCAQAGCPDGSNPQAGLTLATDGNFYGTTLNGSSVPCDDLYGAGCGTVFRITPAGVLTTLYGFDSTYWGHPSAAMIQATDGNFYGTTLGPPYWGGLGQVFKMTPQGSMTTLYNGQCWGGSCAFYSSLIQANDGNLYGTSGYGGIQDDGYSGTAFKITTAGAWSTLFDFYCIYGCGDGAFPEGGLVQGIDGNFYGTASSGEAYDGTVFVITPRGRFTTLYSFCAQPNCADGATPTAGLIQATDGKFYGTTTGLGGPPDFTGTVFSITRNGTLTTLHNFSGPDGADSWAGLLQATNGTFYGVTSLGGANGYGTIFSLSTGLRPFVAFVMGSGKVGQTGGILGQGLTGVTGVSFNGTPANFAVQGDTYLTATIPTGATTGFVTVTSPKGKLISNLPFHVLPQILSFDPPSGQVGTVVTITGVSLTQTQGVGFGNYVLANFTVISDTQVTATVPSGAATGPVGIKTVGGTAASSQTFTVTP